MLEITRWAPAPSVQASLAGSDTDINSHMHSPVSVTYATFNRRQSLSNLAKDRVGMITGFAIATCHKLWLALALGRHG